MVQPLAPIHLGKTRISFLSKNGNRKSTKHYHTLSQGHPSFLGTFFFGTNPSPLNWHPPVIKPSLLENPIKSLFRSMSFSFKPPVIGVLLASHVWLPKGNNKQNTRIFPRQGKCHLVGCLSASKIHNWDDNPIGMASQSRSWNGKESLTYVQTTSTWYTD